MLMIETKAGPALMTGPVDPDWIQREISGQALRQPLIDALRIRRGPFTFRDMLTETWRQDWLDAGIDFAYVTGMPESQPLSVVQLAFMIQRGLRTQATALHADPSFYFHVRENLNHWTVRHLSELNSHLNSPYSTDYAAGKILAERLAMRDVIEMEKPGFETIYDQWVLRYFDLPRQSPREVPVHEA